MPDGNITIILQGTKRFEIDHFIQEEPYLKAVIKKSLPQPDHTQLLWRVCGVRPANQDKAAFPFAHRPSRKQDVASFRF